MRRLPILVLVLALAAPGAAGDAPDLGQGDLTTRLAAAAKLRRSDVPALARALLVLGSGAESGEDAEFLAAYAVREENRALRLLALSSAERRGREAAFKALLKVAKDDTDAVAATRATEALGYLATEDDAAVLEGRLASSNLTVAVAAADGLAHAVGGGEIDTVMEIGLRSADPIVLRHVALAGLDITRSVLRARDACGKAAKAGGEIEKHAAVVTAILEEGHPVPHRWGAALKAIRHVFAGSPSTVHTSATNPSVQAWLDKGLDWLKENYPAEHWLVSEMFDRVDSTKFGRGAEADFEKRSLSLGYDNAALAPERLGVLMTRWAVLALRHRLREPSDGPRGWYAALYDTYDLCVTAGVDGAGAAGGATREHYLKKTLARRPWEKP